jgi:hypothetical protein
MDTKIEQKATGISKNKIGIKSSRKSSILSLLLISILLFSSKVTFAHCDTMDGPLITDAQQAIGQKNVNFVLKWVPAANETEIKDAFNLMLKVRTLSPEAKSLSEMYFFETLVRIHRAAEGVPFSGVKPSGTTIDEKVLAADKSIKAGNLSPLNNMVPQKDQQELKERFEKVMSMKNFDANNVEAGREYIEAYVQFFKFAEGEVEGHAAIGQENGAITASGGHGAEAHSQSSGHATHIPWILSGFFLITTVLFGVLYSKRYQTKIV